MAIEVMFDGMKNVLEADHTYMQDEQTLHGWMFINHITLQWYQQLHIELKGKGLLKKYSVNDYIQMLTDLKKVKITGGTPENIFWSSGSAPKGTYTVSVVYFRGDKSADWSIRTVVNRKVQTFSGHISGSGPTVQVTTFTVR